MFVGDAVVAGLLAAALAASALGKFTRAARVADTLGALGVPLAWFPFLGTALLAGSLGLLAGLTVPLLGVAAGAGIALYFAAAVATHVRAHDRAFAVPAALGLLGAAAALLRLASW